MKKILSFLLLWLFFSSCWNVWWKTILDNTKEKKVMQSLSVKDFKDKINQNYTLIDIRTQQEINNWIIPWTDLFLDFYSKDFISELNKLYKNKKYLIYCAHANRTKYAMSLMNKIWINEVFDLEWWIVNWIDSWEKLILK